MILGIGKMALGLSALVALTEDLGSVLSTHMVAYNRMETLVPGNTVPFSAFHGPRRAHGWYTYGQSIYTHKINIK